MPTGKWNSFGPDGRRYTIAGATNQVIAYDSTGKETIMADSIAGNDIVVANNGNIYVTRRMELKSQAKFT
jgi:hypothetical protein